MALTTATALTLVAIAASAAGTGVAVAGQIEQAKAAEEAGEYNQKVAENNAIAAAQQAQYESERIRKRNLIILGRQKAAVAKAGILDTGSTLDVFLDSAIQGEMDRQAALYSGQTRSGYFRSQGTLARMEGDSLARANYYRAGGTVLSGAGRVASSAYSTNGDTVQGPGGTYVRGYGSGGEAYFPTFED